MAVLRSHWTSALAVLLLGWGAFAPTPALAAEPELVGVLALAMEDDVAKELQLTEGQQRALVDLVDRRESAGLSLALSFKDLSREERLEKLAPYRIETEKQGLKHLSSSQLAKLWKIRAGRDDPAFDPPEVIFNTNPNPVEAKPAEDREAETPVEEQPEKVAADPRQNEMVGLPAKDGKLQFNFRYQPWKDVLDWFAREAGLSMVMDSPPSGTFNYTDNREYTPSEALDVLNGILLTKGYTLVRRERMLFVLDLDDGIPPNLVTDVPVDELDQRGEYELVRTLFTVENVMADDAAAEVEKLLGPQGSVVVLPRAGQLQVTETAGRLRTIRKVLAAADNPIGGSGGNMQSIAFQHVTIGEALPVVRQMLGIPADAFETNDGLLRLGVDSGTGRLLVRGTPELVARVRRVVELIDQPTGGVDSMPQLEVYAITGADSESVLGVLQTLMASEPGVRLATDANTGNLIALARPSQQATIRATIEQMQKDARHIEVIPLVSVDPQVAVLAINKLFDAGGEEPDPKAPRVDADLTSRSLMVRGSSAQIAQIQELLNKLGEDEASGLQASRGNMRVIPLTGASARTALDQLQEIWPTMRPNRIRVMTPSSGVRTYHPSGEEPPTIPPPPRNQPDSEQFQLFEDFMKRLEEQGITDPPGAQSKIENDNSAALAPPPEWLGQRPSGRESGAALRSAPATRSPYVLAQFQVEASGEQNSDAIAGAAKETKPPIIVMPGPSGIVVISDDTEALDSFEEMLSVLSGKSVTGGREYAVFYLKYSKATAAAEILAAIFGADTSGGGLMGGLADAALGDLGGGLMGGLLTGAGGSGGGFSTASVDIVPDARLNALIVNARPADLDTIEQLLQIIDQRVGPQTVEADAAPRPIPVYNNSAADIAEIVETVYQDRIEGGSQRQPTPQDMIKLLRGGSGNMNIDQQIQKMTIGIDPRNNLLIVRAPDPLFYEVKALVEELDQVAPDSQETTRVVTLRRTNAAAVQQALSSIVSGQQSSGNEGANNDRRRDDDDARRDERRQQRRQWEMFRRMNDMQRQIQRAQGDGGDRGGRGDGGGRGGRGGNDGGNRGGN